MSISCGLGYIKTGSEYYYTDCCGNFITGYNNTGVELEVTFNLDLSNSGVGNLNTYVTPVCETPTPTPTPTITPTNTVTPTQTPTNTLTPTPSITPSITPSNTPVTRLKNDCDVITLFDLGVSCNVIQSPTESDPLSGILSLNVTGGTAPYSFVWNGIPGNQTLFGIGAGSYQVVVTDYKCADGSSDYTATTTCVLSGPVPSLTPTTTPTPTPTSPVQCVDLCFIAIAPFGIPNEGPIQFVCDGTQNGRFRWTSDARLDIIWNPINNRWEMYQKYTTPLVPYTLGGGIVASTTFDLIPDSAWDVFGGTMDYSITMTRGECSEVIPLQVKVDFTNTSCQNLTTCNGSLTILAEDGYPPYQYSIDGGLTYSENNTYNYLCPNTYLVKVVDSFNNVYNTNVSIGYDSPVTTYQLTFDVGNATVTTVPNVSKTISQPVTLVVTPPLPVGVSVTFGINSTALTTINSPGTADSLVTWDIRKNGQPVTVVPLPTTTVSQGTRPFCSVNDTQLITSTSYVGASMTITNGDVVTMVSRTTETITNGQVSSQTNCTTNIKTEISAAILTPEVGGNNCSTAVGSSTQIVTNELTYVPTTVVAPLNYNFNYSCTYSPDAIVIEVSNIVGGTTPYQISSSYFSTQAAALANTSWVTSTGRGWGVDETADNTYWVAVKDSTGTILTKSVTTNCVACNFNIGIGFFGVIEAIDFQPSDTKILIGGQFSSYKGNSSYNKLIRIDECGNIDTSFNSGNVGFDSYTTWGVYDIKVIDGGSILVGGQFRKYNNITTNYFLKLNPNGTLDTSFNVGGSGFDFWTRTILLQPLDNKIIVTGNFDTYNGVSSRSIVRLNPNGSRDNTFNVGTGFIGTSGNKGAVDGSVLQSDGKIVAVGRFISYNGTPCNNIIRLNSDGSVDTNFVIGTGFNPVSSSGGPVVVKQDNNGNLLIAGKFTSYNGVPCNNIVRLTPNGSVDYSFNYGSGFNDFVTDLTILNDDSIIVGGKFTTYNSIVNNNIVKLMDNGSIDSSFTSGTGFNYNNSPSSQLFTVTTDSNGKIFAGGYFSKYNSVYYNNFVKLNSNGTSNTTT